MLNHIFVAGRFMSPPLLLLLIVLSWDRTSGQEGCDDGCPPAPLVKKIPPSTAQYEYATSILSDSRSGDTIYKCKSGALNHYSSPAESPAESSILVCKKDTGNFVRRYADGREVAVGATDEYVCRETRCPPPSLDAGTVTVPSPFAVTSCPLTTAILGDTTVLVCSPGGILYDVTDQNKPALVEPGNVPKCTKTSGGWSTDKKVYKCLTTPFIGMETDSCSKELHPDKIAIDIPEGGDYWWNYTVCKNDWPTIYVVRGVDESGARVTLDNDQYRRLTYVPNRGGCGGMWSYFDTLEEYKKRKTVYLKSATCAVTDNILCPCDALLQMPAPNGAVGVPVWLEGARSCQDASQRVSYYWYRADGPPHNIGTPNEPWRYRITCMAGIWVMVNTDTKWMDYPGWQVDEAVCYS